ncbi:MAG: ribose 5-phosphate isomerase B [Bacteroidota bacterium]|nr:ribose 5-phosphate isomerase B [Bacteroidota bacterium]
MKIAIGCDHAGYAYKLPIIEFLKKQGHQIVDVGTDSESSCDYPDFAHPVANKVEEKSVDFGILLCGTANGVAMTANKHAGIRATIAWTEEIAGIVRAHNDSNILCIPSRFVTLDMAMAIVVRYMNTPFEGGRHANRVKKIPC